MKKQCAARQYSDQIHCPRCNLTWDMNDPDRPECMTSSDIGNRELQKMINLIGIENKSLTARSQLVSMKTC